VEWVKAVDARRFDDALSSASLERAVMISSVSLRTARGDDFPPWIGQTRGGQERCLGCDGQAADPGTDEFRRG